MWGVERFHRLWMNFRPLQQHKEARHRRPSLVRKHEERVHGPLFERTEENSRKRCEDREGKEEKVPCRRVIASASQAQVDALEDGHRTGVRVAEHEDGQARCPFPARASPRMSIAAAPVSAVWQPRTTGTTRKGGSLKALIKP